MGFASTTGGSTPMLEVVSKYSSRRSGFGFLKVIIFYFDVHGLVNNCISLIANKL